MGWGRYVTDNIMKFRTRALALWFVDLVRLAALVILLGLVPYSMFAGYNVFIAASASSTGTSAGALVYAIARLGGCLLLVYALWRLRQAAARLRKYQRRS
jgi:TRAP-type C4-dicarboxylate transport system permease small subunit